MALVAIRRRAGATETSIRAQFACAVLPFFTTLSRSGRKSSPPPPLHVLLLLLNPTLEVKSLRLYMP